MKNLYVASILMIIAATCTAEEDILKSGFTTLANSGFSAAFAKWMEGNPIAGTPEAKSQMHQSSLIDDLYGEYVSYDVYREVTLNKQTRIVYVIINYSVGPLFAKFVVYEQPSGDFMIPSLLFHTDPRQVWPQSLLAGSE